MNKIIKNYIQANKEVAKEFYKQVFYEKNEEETLESLFDYSVEPHHEWTLCDIGNIWISIHDMITVLKWNEENKEKVTYEQFIEWYYGVIYEKKQQNLINFLEYGWIVENV